MGRVSFRFAVIAFVVAMSCVLVSAGDAKLEAIQKDRKKFEGTWRVTSLEISGEKSADDNVTKIRVINTPGGNWTLMADDKEVGKGTSEIDPTKKIKTIDFLFTEGAEQGKTFVGIYDLGENTRKICFAPAEKDRPTEFSTQPSSGHILMMFERVKAK